MPALKLKRKERGKLTDILDILKDSLIDTAKLIPFLFATYLLMEFIEHKTSDKSKAAIGRAGKFGPVIGGILGIIPQCGFSASAASLYSGRIITAGTLIAVFLSTSDEMLPICISERVAPSIIIEILAIKAVVAIIIGIGIDIIIRMAHKDKQELDIHCLCEDEHCHCDEDGIFKSAIKHTLQITLFIFIATLLLGTAIHFLGEERLSKIFVDVPVAGCAISALVGLIPNCAASVVITELYLSGIIKAGAMIAGLLTGSGIGILVLFRTNKHHLKENLAIVFTLFISGVIIGSLIEFIGINM